MCLCVCVCVHTWMCVSILSSPSPWRPPYQEDVWLRQPHMLIGRERKQVIGWAVGCHISRVYLCDTVTHTHTHKHMHTHTHWLVYAINPHTYELQQGTNKRYFHSTHARTHTHAHTQLWDEIWCVRCADPAIEDRRNINGATRPLLWQLAQLTQVGSTIGLSCYMFTFSLFVTHT